MATAEEIIAALGGVENIRDVESCMTRLRTDVSDASLVNEQALKDLELGVVAVGTGIQVIVGPEADTLAQVMKDIIE
jgi:PTS system N-acetylglucosamine-specific IIB component